MSAKVTFEVDANVTAAKKKIEQLEAQLKGLRPQVLDPKVDTDKARKEIQALEKEVRQLNNEIKAVGGGGAADGATEAKSKFEALEEATDHLGRVIPGAGDALENFGKIAKQFGTAGIALGGIVALGAAVVAFTKFSIDATIAMEAQGRANRIMAGGFDAIERATYGAIEASDALQANNRLAAAGLSVTAEQYQTLSAYAREFALGSGQETSEVFQEITTAIADKNVPALRALGINIRSASTANQALSSTLRSANADMTRNGTSAQTMAEKMRMAEIAWQNAMNSFASTGLARGAIDLLVETLNGIPTAIAGIQTAFDDFIGSFEGMINEIANLVGIIDDDRAQAVRQSLQRARSGTFAERTSTRLEQNNAAVAAEGAGGRPPPRPASPQQAAAFNLTDETVTLIGRHISQLQSLDRVTDILRNHTRLLTDEEERRLDNQDILMENNETLMTRIRQRISYEQTHLQQLRARRANIQQINESETRLLSAQDALNNLQRVGIELTARHIDQQSEVIRLFRERKVAEEELERTRVQNNQNERVRQSDSARWAQEQRAQRQGVMNLEREQNSFGAQFRQNMRSNTTMAKVFADSASNSLQKFADAGGTAFEAIITGADNMGAIVGEALKQTIKGIAVESATKALFEGAMALASLALGDIKGAILHGNAAAAFGIVAGVAGGITGGIAAAGGFDKEKPSTSSTGSSIPSNASATARESEREREVRPITILINGFAATERGVQESIVMALNEASRRGLVPRR